MKYSIFKYLICLSTALSILISFTSFGGKSPKSTREILEDIQAESINADIPNITLKTLNDKSLNIRESLTGSVTFVSVWRSGCSFCREEAPKFAKMVRSFKPKDNVTFAYISWDRDVDAAIAFKNEFNIRDESIVFMDPMGEILQRTHMGTKGTPTVFLIDKQGKIIAKTIGLRSWDDEKTITDMKILAKNLQS